MLCGMLNDVFILGGLLCAHYLPPLPPTYTVEQVHEHYVKHERGVQFCETLFVLTGITYPFFTAGITNQIRRIPGISETLVTAWVIASATVGVLLLIPGLFICQVAYRLDRSPEVTSMLNDIIWLYVVVPFSPLLVQGWTMALAIYQDYAADSNPSPTRHLWPRWLGWFSFGLPFVYFPACACHFVYTGPLAWNGILAFWIPVICFGIQLNVQNWETFKVIGKVMDHEREDCE